MKKMMLGWGPIVSAIAITISYIPQIVLTFQTRDVSGQSVLFWLLLCISLFFLMMQQVGLIKYENTKSKTGLIAQVINFGCALIMLIMVLLWK